MPGLFHVASCLVSRGICCGDGDSYDWQARSCAQQYWPVLLQPGGETIQEVYFVPPPPNKPAQSCCLIIFIRIWVSIRIGK